MVESAGLLRPDEQAVEIPTEPQCILWWFRAAVMERCTATRAARQQHVVGRGVPAYLSLIIQLPTLLEGLLRSLAE